jgi:UDP-N-acetylglucosamine--N-acetylmuramyl-(pentapeptide) pyrophosphoryl-undecaprenol N-acetylglucosamine transferase
LLTATREAGLRMFGISADSRVLLVFGGSGGSVPLNRAMAATLDKILEDPRVHVVWQAGLRYFEECRSMVPARDRLTLLGYIDRMPLAYAAADLVLCRSGAITCSELEVSGTPAILVPSPNVAEDHQTWNARSIVADGGAVLLPEKDLAARLVTQVQALIGDDRARAKMRSALLARARPDAAATIARDVIAIARGEA